MIDFAKYLCPYIYSKPSRSCKNWLDCWNFLFSPLHPIFVETNLVLKLKSVEIIADNASRTSRQVLKAHKQDLSGRYISPYHFNRSNQILARKQFVFPDSLISDQQKIKWIKLFNADVVTLLLVWVEWISFKRRITYWNGWPLKPTF